MYLVTSLYNKTVCYLKKNNNYPIIFFLSVKVDINMIFIYSCQNEANVEKALKSCDEVLSCLFFG